MFHDNASWALTWILTRQGKNKELHLLNYIPICDIYIPSGACGLDRSRQLPLDDSTVFIYTYI
jgi:hypothetical protein